jgi:uncharacterized protein (DUF433 family)
MDTGFKVRLPKASSTERSGEFGLKRYDKTRDYVMHLEIHTPELEQRMRRQIQSGHFHDVDELLTKALDALDEKTPAAAPNEANHSDPHAQSDIDWMACELIEAIPGKVSGRPIVRGTRILPDAIVNSYDAGDTLDFIHENYPGLTIAQIRRLIEFAHAQRGQPAL